MEYHIVNRILLAVLLLILLPGSSVLAETAPPSLDVVFVIDQSGSMWGSKDHPHANDPQGHRVEAVKIAIDRLAEDVNQTTREHRVTVIDFDSKVDVPLSQLKLKYDPNNPDEVLQRAHLAGSQLKLRQDEPRRFTNTPQALAQAVTEFNAMNPNPTGARKRVLLLITDGRPFMPHAAGTKYETMLETMRKSIESHLFTLRNTQVDLWVVGLNDADNYWYDSRYGEADGAFWERLAVKPNGARLVADTSFPKLPDLVSQIVDQWVGTTSTALQGDTMEVPPFNARVTFNIVYRVASNPPRILDPDEVERLPDVPPDPNAKSVRISIPNPKPGTYRIVDRTPDHHITVEFKKPWVERLNPVGKPGLQQTVPLVLRVVGDQGKPIFLEPGQITEASVRVEAPSGKVENLPLAPAIGAQFRTNVSWTPAEPGPHKLRLQVKANYNGQTVALLDDSGKPLELAIDVSSERPVALTLLTPDPTARLISLPLLDKLDHLDLHVGLGDYEGNPVKRLEDFVPQPDNWLAVQLIDASGVPLAQPVPMQRQNGDSYWTGTVPITLSWAIGEGWYRPAKVYLQFLPASQQLAQDRVLGGLYLPPDAVNRRVAGIPFSVGPIEIAWPIWLSWLLPIAVVAVTIGIALYLLFYVYPATVIHGLDQRRTGRLELRVFDMENDPLQRQAMKFTITRRPYYNGDGKVTIDIKGERKVIKKFRFKRSLWARQRAQGTLAYRLPGADRKSRRIVLTEGDARPLGEEAKQYYVSLEAA